MRFPSNGMSFMSMPAMRCVAGPEEEGANPST
jgi:hypothetical protein